MNLQETYDTVLFALRKQGVASVAQLSDPTGSVCRYRGPNGLKCAAGHLIPDEAYDESFEEIPIEFIEFFKNREDFEFVVQLQKLHDISLRRFGLDAWEFQMVLLAIEHGLKYTKP